MDARDLRLRDYEVDAAKHLDRYPVPPPVLLRHCTRLEHGCATHTLLFPLSNRLKRHSRILACVSFRSPRGAQLTRSTHRAAERESLRPARLRRAFVVTSVSD